MNTEAKSSAKYQRTWALGCSSMVAHLPRKSKVLGLILATDKNQQTKLKNTSKQSFTVMRRVGSLHL
jgi:hypothetical protein